jgi:polyisoprenoid-binding protein YceI
MIGKTALYGVLLLGAVCPAAAQAGGIRAGNIQPGAVQWAAAHPTIDVPSLAKAAGRYTISGSSTVAFRVDQMGGGGIKGRFGRFSGTFTLKAGDLAHAVVNFDLKPESVSTGQERVDAFLRSSAVFDCTRFDTITFRSDHVEQTGPDSARVTGTLTAKGHSAAESFDVKLTSWQGRTIGFNVSGRILRSHYAMDVGTPVYSNVVQFDMAIEGQRGG